MRRILNVILWSTLVYYVSALGILNYQTRTPSTIIGLLVLVSACIWPIFCTMFVLIFILWLSREFLSWRKRNKRVEVYDNKSPQLDEQSGPKDVLKLSGFRPRLIQ